MVYIEMTDVKKYYNKGLPSEVRALNGINLKIEKGEMISIEGVSGSGKSTLLHILGCLDMPTSGKYFLEGKDVRNLNGSELAVIRNKKIGFVLQEFGLILNKSAIENVSVPLLFAKKKIREIHMSSKNALRRVGMENFAHTHTNRLSGGQKQRVAIARAIANDPAIILADEPTGAIDSTTSIMIMELFKSLNQQGKTVVIVTHDPIVSMYCPRKLTIKDGLIAENGVPVCI